MPADRDGLGLVVAEQGRNEAGPAPGPLTGFLFALGAWVPEHLVPAERPLSRRRPRPKR
jgi:hypothetical protein